jgi:hypothetical protein
MSSATFRPAVVASAMALLASSSSAQTCEQLAEAIKAHADRSQGIVRALEQKPDVNCRLASGLTPLMVAARGRATEIVKTLLDHGADVNASTGDGDTALLYAAYEGNAAVVDLLVKAGADPRARTRQNVTPPLLAARANDRASVDLLLTRGADPNITHTRNDATTFAERRAIVETPLTWAASHGNTGMIRALLDAKARVLVWTSDGTTPSQAARRKGHHEAHRLLDAAEKSEYAPVPTVVAGESIALQRIRHLTLNPGEISPGLAIDNALTKRMTGDVEAMTRRWRVIPREESFAWTMTRLATAMEWALHTKDADLIRAVADDLSTKRRDCDSRPEGRFGAVKISVRTVSSDASERQGFRVRYLEQFFFDLLKKKPDLESQWREFGMVSAIKGEPLAAGDYVLVAWGDGKAVSDPKRISIGRELPTLFDLVVR